MHMGTSPWSVITVYYKAFGCSYCTVHVAGTWTPGQLPLAYSNPVQGTDSARGRMSLITGAQPASQMV